MSHKTIIKKIVGLTVLAFTVLLLSLTGCQQHSNANAMPVKPSIYGLWEGTYITNQVDHLPTYCSFIIFPDGSFLKKSQVTTHTDEFQLTKGSWKLNGDQFEYRDTVLLYSGGIVIDEGKLIFHDNGTMDHGTWKDVSGQSYSGKFQQMRKVY